MLNRYFEKGDLWFCCNCCFISVITLEIDTLTPRLTSESGKDRVLGDSVVPSSFVQGSQVEAAQTVSYSWGVAQASYVTCLSAPRARTTARNL